MVNLGALLFVVLHNRWRC